MMKQLLSLLLLFVAVTATAQTEGGARIRLHTTSHNFGDTPRRGGDVVFPLTVTNEGDAPLILTRVVTTCSCVKGFFDKRPIPAGECAIIEVVYQPQKSNAGVFNKVLQIHSNAVNGRQVFTVQGNAVEERVKVKRQKVKIK